MPLAPARSCRASCPALALGTVIVALVALLQPVSPTAPTAPTLPEASSPAHGSETWSASLAEAASSATVANAYAIVPEGGDWRATITHQALEATFSASGLSVTSSDRSRLHRPAPEAGGIGPHVSVVRDGTGTGTVTSDPAGINCGADCEEDFAQNTTVTLTAAPDPGSTFTGFDGCDSVTDIRCTVIVDAATTVTATFTVQATTTTTSSTSTTSTTLAPGGTDLFEGYRPASPVQS